MNCIVIGAGIVGCAVAHELASRGAGVRIIEMRDVGRGASQASAGVLCPHIEGHAAPLLRLGTRSLELYDGFIEKVRRDTNAPLEYRRNGTLEVALNDEEAAHLRELADRHTADRIEHQYLIGRETRELEPALSEDAAAGLLIPEHGYVAVGLLTRALAAAASARGAAVEHRRARRIVRHGGGVRVTVDDGVLDADAVVVAAGSWSSEIHVGGTEAPVKPIRGQLLQLAFPAPPASRVVWGTGCYMVPWTSGSVLVGATVEDVGFDESTTVAGVRDLLDAACELMPAAWSARFEGVRAGLRPATSDELPIIGRSSAMSGLFYATGHYRNGVLLAPFTAAAIADLVLEGRAAPELDLTQPARFGL